MNLTNRRRHRRLVLLIAVFLGLALIAIERSPIVDGRMDVLPAVLP